jgi:hypothetical protein
MVLFYYLKGPFEVGFFFSVTTLQAIYDLAKVCIKAIGNIISVAMITNVWNNNFKMIGCGIYFKTFLLLFLGNC